MKGYLIIYDETHAKQPEVLDISKVKSINFDIPTILKDKWHNGVMITKTDGSEFGYLNIREIRIIISIRHGPEEMGEDGQMD